MKCLIGLKLARLGWAGVFMLLTWAVDCAQAAPPTTSSNRFLFIIDVASGQKSKSEEALRQSLFDLIYSGVRGHMKNGDSYGVWLAGGVNDTSGTVEVWRDKFAFELAARAALRIKDHGLKGKPCLKEAIADATRVAANVGEVTVILVSDGHAPFSGTPFDSDINLRLTAVAEPIRQVKGAVNTVLVAREGAFVAWAVNSPEFLISMPELPPITPKAKPQVAAAPATPEAVVKQAAASADSKAAAARVASKPIIITRETVDREKQVTRALASTLDGQSGPAANSNAPIAQEAAMTSVTNEAQVVPAKPAPMAKAVAAVSTTAPSNAASAVQPPPPPAEELSNATSAATMTPAPAAEDLKGFKGPEEDSTPASAAAPGQPNRSLHPLVYAALGGGIIAALGATLFWIWRRRRPEESLISRAIAMERLHGRL